ncbi:MAG TPA: hypothetical protein VNM46_11380 [Xanthobacteraceae bacterium]|nr:hypothetical protein [Xanthobacteraceae bacterium]
MSDLNISVESNINRLVLHLDQMPDELKRRLEVKISELTMQLLSRVKAAEPVRTGRLRAATRSFVDVRQDFVRGRVRVLSTGKAQSVGAAFGALEYGAPGKRRSGPVRVRGYSRSSGAVAAYQRRRPHITARRFLRGPAAAMRSRALAELEAIVGKALQDELNKI